MLRSLTQVVGRVVRSGLAEVRLIKHAPVTSVVICKNMSSAKFGLSKKLIGTEKNIWVEFGKLATECKALNLGQGFPDFKPPEHVLEALETCARSGNFSLSQYTRSYGHPRLVNALAKVNSPLIGREIDPMTQVLVSVGAYGALFCTIQGLLNPGDEVIIIEPFFDCYEPMVRVAGGTPRFVALRPKSSGESSSSGDFTLDPKELESQFNEKTKLIILNTPNNPLGKVFLREELEMVAALCKKYDVVCVADEVYEWMTYPGHKHIKIASLPGMWERTLTIGSAGKTFSATGWKLGWTVGPEHLMSTVMTMHVNCNYTCPTILQEAVAIGFEKELSRLDSPDCYFRALPAELLPKRDMLAKTLKELGMTPIIPEGGYFIMTDVSKFSAPDDGSGDPKDFQFVRWMTREKKLAAIPPSAFYSKEHKFMAEKYIRFCFIKEDSTLKKAAKILQEWKASL
ncbi:kynurenine aminotransferase-like isoform X1 [Haliotis cracherodii]|uniref:kynurenine aminotransferase-like isoform X1 n=2 Tax=Haliotis cracherodii TaxID=6455 RepID=UPI0039EBFBF4